MDETTGLTKFASIDPELEKAQWAQWRTSRRRLLGAGFAAAGGLALAGIGGPRLLGAPAAAAQEGTPVSGGSLAMSLADDDVQSFDPVIPSDNMSIWTKHDFVMMTIQSGFWA